MSVPHAPATWHTCERNAEEERSQINTSQMGRMGHNITVTALNFLKLPLECACGCKSHFPAISCLWSLSIGST